MALAPHERGHLCHELRCMPYTDPAIAEEMGEVGLAPEHVADGCQNLGCGFRRRWPRYPIIDRPSSEKQRIGLRIIIRPTRGFVPDPVSGCGDRRFRSSRSRCGQLRLALSQVLSDERDALRIVGDAIYDRAAMVGFPTTSYQRSTRIGLVITAARRSLAILGELEGIAALGVAEPLRTLALNDQGRPWSRSLLSWQGAQKRSLLV